MTGQILAGLDPRRTEVAWEDDEALDPRPRQQEPVRPGTEQLGAELAADGGARRLKPEPDALASR